MANEEGPFSGLVKVLGSAVFAVGAVFALSASVLSNLVPPFEDSPETVAYAHIGALVLLLLLSLVVRGRLTRRVARRLAFISSALFLGSVLLFLELQDLTRTYVYRYPPSDTTSASQSRHVRGELNERGRILVGNGSVANAVLRNGGPSRVRSNGDLWDESSRAAVVSTMQKFYVGFTFVTVTALFVALLAVTAQWMNKPRARGNRDSAT